MCACACGYVTTAPMGDCQHALGPLSAELLRQTPGHFANASHCRCPEREPGTGLCLLRGKSRRKPFCTREDDAAQPSCRFSEFCRSVYECPATRLNRGQALQVL